MKMTLERRMIMTTVSTIASAAGLLLFVFAMLSAAVSDLMTYKIRNKLILMLLLAYLAVAPIAGIPSHEIARSVAVAGVALLISFALFAAGWIGAGDGKLVAVTTLWLGADNAFAYLVLLSLLGGLLAVIVYFCRTSLVPERLAKIGWIAQLRSRAEGVELPYGVAITLASLGVLPSTPWMSEMTWRI
jgi:prepilin peptidase CpaA